MHDAGLAEEWDRQDATRLITLEQLDANLFRNRFNQRNLNDALYGGQVLAQSLAAAQATVEGRPVHSLHGYFLRSGKMPRSVFYQVEATRDGRAFSTRRVTAIQSGQPIFHMECSFHAEEPGYSHQIDPRSVPAPDALRSTDEILAEKGHGASGRPNDDRWPLEVRPVDAEAMFALGDGARNTRWMRLDRPVASDDPALHAQLLAYLSDFGLSGAALERHEPWVGPSKVFLASIDHAMWFHRPARVDEWLLFQFDSPSAGGGVGFSRGLIYDQAGNLVASTAQESLQRFKA